MNYAFKAEQPGHALPYGIEHASDPDGETILHVDWFTTETERDHQLAYNKSAKPINLENQ